MPRYDYQCQTCFHHFEVKQSFSSEPVATCPVCTNSAKRVIHAVPVVFKGSGFYVNDYGKGASSTDSSPKSADSKTDKDSKAEPETPSTSASKDGTGKSKGESKKEPAAKK